MIFAALATLTVASVGCNSTRQAMSRCSLFGNRGAQCDACTVPSACCPQPSCCDPCGGGGYYSGASYGGGYAEMAPSLSGGSCGCNGGMVPQDGMIYGGGVQVMPSPSTSPMLVPTQPMPGPETSLQP
jgi:hypothetical protein